MVVSHKNHHQKDLVADSSASSTPPIKLANPKHSNDENVDPNSKEARPKKISLEEAQQYRKTVLDPQSSEEEHLDSDPNSPVDIIASSALIHPEPHRKISRLVISIPASQNISRVGRASVLWIFMYYLCTKYVLPHQIQMYLLILYRNVFNTH